MICIKWEFSIERACAPDESIPRDLPHQLRGYRG
jgi:hypothetical protein